MAASADQFLPIFQHILEAQKASATQMVALVKATQNSFLNISTTSTSATAGTNGAVPGQVSLYANVQIGGVSYKIPLFNP